MKFFPLTGSSIYLEGLRLGRSGWQDLLLPPPLSPHLCTVPGYRPADDEYDREPPALTRLRRSAHCALAKYRNVPFKRILQRVNPKGTANPERMGENLGTGDKYLADCAVVAAAR